jgi:ABC-type uncharacterized transport system YnjBCD permease subunit
MASFWRSALAFAIGLVLIMPSGWIARFLAQAITGWNDPPRGSTQDPFRISLTALVAKRHF